MKVTIWKDGYASDNTATVELADDADIDVEVRKRFGSFARVALISREAPQVEEVTEEYAQEMSRFDNS